jgi:hypothetical protein
MFDGSTVRVLIFNTGFFECNLALEQSYFGSRLVHKFKDSALENTWLDRKKEDV